MLQHSYPVLLSFLQSYILLFQLPWILFAKYCCHPTFCLCIFWEDLLWFFSAIKTQKREKKSLEKVYHEISSIKKCLSYSFYEISGTYGNVWECMEKDAYEKVWTVRKNQTQAYTIRNHPDLFLFAVLEN